LVLAMLAWPLSSRYDTTTTMTMTICVCSCGRRAAREYQNSPRRHVA
jgi:hypothetical protein